MTTTKFVGGEFMNSMNGGITATTTTTIIIIIFVVVVIYWSHITACQTKDSV